MERAFLGATMRQSWLVAAAAIGLSIGAFVPAARAQDDLYSAGYCEPSAGTKLLYSNRAYEIEPKPVDAPPLYYSYKILAPGNGKQQVERRSQLLFDDGTDKWNVETGSDDVQDFWPLQPSKELDIRRDDQQTGVHAEVSFLVLGLEPINSGTHVWRSWKIRRRDTLSDGSHYFQFLWYAPEICTLSAFTDSQHRVIRLLRVLEPGDKDYDRPLEVKKHRLYFSDTGDLVK
jgi:hypothetical protein